MIKSAVANGVTIRRNHGEEKDFNQPTKLSTRDEGNTFRSTSNPTKLLIEIK